MADAPWGPGHVIDGKYLLTSKLGEGGMGAVWRADHLTLKAPVAVKLLDPGIAATEDGLARFMREAQAAAALRSAHVVQTFDYGVFDGVPFIVMELLVGDSLGERLASGGPLAPPAVALLLKQVGRAISKAHQQGIIHRDLKPDNIFLVESEGDDFTAKVLDFGIAKSTSILELRAGSKTRTGALLGTPYYMSPEQAQGVKEVDFRTDLWALAVITYECITGVRPFESEALGDLLLKICVSPLPIASELGPVPLGFDEWFAKAASREREDRFASATEMARAFERLLNPGRLSISDSQDSLLPSMRGTSALQIQPIALSAPLALQITRPEGEALSLHTTPAGDSLEGTLVFPGSLRASNRSVVWITTAATLFTLAVILGIFAYGARSGDAPAGIAAGSAREAVTAPSSPPVETPAPAGQPPVASSLPSPPPSPTNAPAPANDPSGHYGTLSRHRAPPPKASRAVIPVASPAAQKTVAPFDPLLMRH